MRKDGNHGREDVLNKHTGAALGLALGIIGGSLLLNVSGAGTERAAELGAVRHIDAPVSVLGQARAVAGARSPASSKSAR